MEPIFRLPTRQAAVLFVLSVAFTLGVNALNLAIVGAQNPSNAIRGASSTVHGYTIWSADNSYYLPPAQNFLAGRGYIIDPENPQTRILRTPGYPAFYALHYVLFGEEGSFRVIRLTQTLLLALAVVLLADAVLRLGGDRRLALLSGVLFALCPFTAIYAFHTITESLYPFLMMVSLNVFARAREKASWGWYAATGTTLVVTVLTRPVTGLLLPVFVAVLLVLDERPFATRVRGVLALAGAFALALSPWVVRNWYVSGGRFIPLEDYKVFIGFGSGFEGFRRWWSAWHHPGNAPIDYAKNVLATLDSPTPQGHEALARAQVAAFPPLAFRGASHEEVAGVVLQLNRCLEARLRALRAERPHSNNLRLAPPLACDLDVERTFDDLRARLRRAAPFSYYLLVPLGTLREAVVHSGSYAYGSLNPPGRRLSSLQFAVKGAMFVLELSLFASLVCALRLPRPLGFLVAGFPVVMLAYLIYGLRVVVEGRYLIAVYPFLCVTLACLLGAAAERLTRWVRPGSAETRLHASL
jgi:4-amino-4-deoxy-L-arabinose transferase-like glycosyltransferase